MIPIQIILTANFLAFILIVFRIKTKSLLFKSVALIFDLVAIFLIWNPDLTVVVANLLGIGRGADLILYCATALGILVALKIHILMRNANEDQTKLARKITLLENEIKREKAMKD